MPTPRRAGHERSRRAERAAVAPAVARAHAAADAPQARADARERHGLRLRDDGGAAANGTNGSAAANRTADGAGCGASGAPPRSPIHIVYVLADDVGWNDFGYQSTDLGGETLPHGGATPTLDRLARRACGSRTSTRCPTARRAARRC